ncbi:hypothetical protein A6279_20975 [Bacillus wiedmannii]|nr:MULTISPECIES: hypothetical protein [Bacillus cereus group]KAA0778868.1 hypothetical protein DN392_01830 [Bacillus sp. BB51/4]KXY07371.1 hypothetical protein AT260_07095 [Bacillus wiedmannii]OAK13201.1 hypothetical protein A6278_21295 [Bacillus wiedmannii]OAK14203.1 hypothetical protein A6279_20975 [Bacillus wiedmannii]OAK25941.1 hypothetical protein A6281_18390 [Bacillus wiedmannii]
MFEMIFNKSKDINPISKLEEVSRIIPSADVLRFFDQLTQAYTENQITQRDIARIEAQREVLLTEINRKYDVYQYVFKQIFDEREKAINKSFAVIDKGMNEGDKELISMGLKSLSTVVSSSPFSNIQQLSELLEGNKVFEI